MNTPPARTSARNTATFQPYYWEAYSEIVQPHRFDHYLVRRWLPELGALGFAIVKALRDRCYHNPATGVLRDRCEVDMEELARQLGISRPTLFREFGRNEALQQFVRRIKQYQMVNGKPRQDANLYQVCMDDPVHPDDYARYDELRAERERERNQPPPTKVVKGKVQSKAPAYESQSDTHSRNGRSYGSQIETPDPKGLQDQTETPDTSYPPAQSETAYVDLPSGGSIPSDSIPPAAGDAPPINSPQGDGEGESSSVPEALRDSLLCGAWQQALRALAAAVNKPTFEGHLKPLQPVALDEAAGTVELLCPSAFTREWLDKRHRPAIEEALGAALGRPITVRLMTSSTSISKATGAIPHGS